MHREGWRSGDPVIGRLPELPELPKIAEIERQETLPLINTDSTDQERIGEGIGKPGIFTMETRRKTGKTGSASQCANIWKSVQKWDGSKLRANG